MLERSACGKIILIGEHAVVYGRPAIALPLPSVRAYARVQAIPKDIEIDAPDIKQHFWMDERPDHPLSLIVKNTLAHLGVPVPSLQLTVTSDMAVASHLGSGAAVSVACARAVAAFVGVDVSAAVASELAFEVEKMHHGTPSGIDNTVIAYEQPVWFMKGEPPTPLVHVQSSILDLVVVADTGTATPTKIPVAHVRESWERDKPRYEQQFDAIGMLAMVGRKALETQNWAALGTAMTANHAALQRLGVSALKLDELCEAALLAGALGAKMSGGGRGGNIIALAQNAAHADQLKQALRDAGAKKVY